MYQERPKQQRKRQSRPPTRLDRTGPGRQTGYVSVRSLKSLANHVLARRGELNLTQEEFARRGGIHVKTLQRIESGDIDPRVKTIGAIDRAADWKPGSARTVINGGEPTPLEAATDPYTVRDDFERQIMELDTMPLEERWTFIFAHRRRQSTPEQPSADERLRQSG